MCLALGAVGVLVLPAASSAADLPRIELVVMNAPKEVPASSSFYVRVKLVNVGTVPVRGCVVELGRIISPDPCLTLGYRFWQVPRRLEVDGVDTLQFLSRRDVLGPGESLERSVRLVSSRRTGAGTLHLYAISGRPDELHWIHRPLPITVGVPPFEVRRREIVTLALFALYVLGVGWALLRLATGLYRGWRHSCSS